MKAIGGLGLCAVALVLALQGVGEAQTGPKNKAVRITNKQSVSARICAGIKKAPCRDAGKGECKQGTESNPDVPCQYQMNESNGLVETILLPK